MIEDRMTRGDFALIDRRAHGLIPGKGDFVGSMTFSLERFRKTHATDSTEVVVRGRRFEILVPAFLEKFTDPEDVFRNFPLWSKVWEASWILADHLAVMPVEPKKHFLDIGSGIGLAGRVAASYGHELTLSEPNARCLEFLRPNAVLTHSPDLKILDMA